MVKYITLENYLFIFTPIVTNKILFIKYLFHYGHLTLIHLKEKKPQLISLLWIFLISCKLTLCNPYLIDSWS